MSDERVEVQGVLLSGPPELWPKVVFPDQSGPVEELSQWWRDRSEAEIEATVPKAVEYGPNSMIEVGRAMGRMSQRDLTDEEAIEVACMFYICGKVGRWVDAVAHGQRPSDDTLFDIGVYVKMAQRNREVGSWPGVDLG